MRTSFLRRSVGILIVTGVVLCLSACGSSPTPTPNPMPSPSPTPSPSASHLYVTTSSGQILQFTLPLTSTSTPSVVVSSTGTLIPFQVAVDFNGNVAVTESGGNLAIYHPPLTSSSTPAAVFPNGAFPFIGPIVFDSAGNLFVSGGGTSSNGSVNIFVPPFSSASTPSQVLPVSGFNGGLDISGNLYLNVGGSSGPCGIDMLAPPYTGAPSTFVSQSCIDGGFQLALVTDNLLFVSFTTSCDIVIDAFPLPGSTATVGGVGPSCSFGAFAADSNGNLYVADITKNGISVFAPPFFSTSVPTMTLSNVPGVNGMAIGK